MTVIVENNDNNDQTISRKRMINGNNDEDIKKDKNHDEDKKKDKNPCVRRKRMISDSTDTHVEDRQPMNKNKLPVCNPTYAEMTARKVRKKLES